MAGSRVTHGTTVTGTATTHLTGAWNSVEVTNWGTTPLMVVAVKGGSAAPTLTWKGDDEDVVPAGASVTVPVAVGDEYDQGAGGGSQPGTDVYVLAQASGSDYTVSGLFG